MTACYSAVVLTLACRAFALIAALALPVVAELAREVPGTIEKLPAPSAHWAWISDLVLERSALIDIDSGRFLGIINGGYGAIAPLFPKSRAEVYLPTTYFSRRTRGERTDLLEIYDLTTLSPVAEVKLPAKRAIDAVPVAHSALSDDDRFVAVFNWTPRTSLSIVDVEHRRLASEIEISGCSLVYAAGARRFLSLCADGSALVVTIDDSGREVSKQRSEPFFDPKQDPVTEKAVRIDQEWLFVSFAGWVYPVDVSAKDLAFGDKWSLFEPSERDETWKIGGWQHLAVHEQSGRLFSLVHQGGKDTHKDPGEEVWVYHLRSRQRIRRIPLRFPGLTIYGFEIEPERDLPAPLGALAQWAMDSYAPASVTHIQVTPGDQPRLLTATQFSGSLGVYDAHSGEWLKRVQPIGWTTDLILAPGAAEAR